MTTAFPQADPESLVARIITELQANPEAQTLLLRALLTQEFLGMPVRLERIEGDIASINVHTGRLETDVAAIKGDIAALNVRTGRLETDVAALKGDMLEVKLHRRIRPLLSQRLGLRQPRMMHSPVQDTSLELLDAVQNALDDSKITDAQETRISETDMILHAQRKSDRAEVWVAVEVSNDIGQHDIERAEQSAAALRAVFPEVILAAVAGYRLHPLDQERADRADVHTLLVEETG
jgi:hypothetical protein